MSERNSQRTDGTLSSVVDDKCRPSQRRSDRPRQDVSSLRRGHRVVGRHETSLTGQEIPKSSTSGERPSGQTAHCPETTVTSQRQESLLGRNLLVVVPRLELLNNTKD